MSVHGRSAAIVVACLALLLALAMFLAVGCGESNQGADTGNQDGQADGDEDGGQADDGTAGGPVTLTLYFLGGDPADLYLKAEERTIPYTVGTARAAMEELFKGPAADSALQALFPDTVEVLSVSIEDGICTVDISKEIITDKAAQGGAGAEAEALALDSIANTLTEFSTVDRVKLLIEGKQSGMVDGLFIEDFWGHVGLPEYLERDMSGVR